METVTHKSAKKAIQRQWVAGTVAVFFTTLLKSLVVHIHQASLTPNWPYTVDLFTRYGYLLCLMIYFFMSNLRIDQSDHPKDLPFDVIQSLASFTTLIALDFMVPGYGIPVGQFWWAVTVANVTILIIAPFALKWFPSDGKLNYVRWGGIGCAIASIIVVWLPIPESIALALVLLLEGGLLAVLAIFVRRRWPTA